MREKFKEIIRSIRTIVNESGSVEVLYGPPPVVRATETWSDWDFSNPVDAETEKGKDPFEGVAVPPREALLLFLVDSSENMKGLKIAHLNTAVLDINDRLYDNYLGPFAHVNFKVNILDCVDPVNWVYPEPVDIFNYYDSLRKNSEWDWDNLLDDHENSVDDEACEIKPKWRDFEAKGTINWEKSFGELSKKLSKSDGWITDIMSHPVIILLSDGKSTKGWTSSIEKLKDNQWFKMAYKIVIAIGDDADFGALACFTGYNESVMDVHRIDQLPEMIKEYGSWVIHYFEKYAGVAEDTEINRDTYDIFMRQHRKLLIGGDTINLKGGRTCVVRQEIGRGGRRVVYAVDCEGEEYALFWYTTKPYTESDFCAHLERIINLGVPDANFLWPLAITERKENGGFGYLTRMRPSNYYAVSEFMLFHAQFANVKAQLNACLQITKAFQKLHELGLCFYDFNGCIFYINPDTGDVLVNYDENVGQINDDMNLLGNAHYMAPEIVEGKATPNEMTDYHTLAVCLFLVIYANRPFEGEWYLNYDSWDVKEFFGFSSVFIMDPSDPKNRPVKGIHNNVIKRWPIYPSLLANAFCKTFSKEAINDPIQRLTDKQWLNILLQVRSMFIKCPNCGKGVFFDLQQPNKPCAFCNNPFPAFNSLKAGKFTIPLVAGQIIYDCQVAEQSDYNLVTGEVIEKDGQLGIRNLSPNIWTVQLTDGSVKQVVPGKGMPVQAGLKIKFGDVDGWQEII
jgi:uncharacterized protein YegL